VGAGPTELEIAEGDGLGVTDNEGEGDPDGVADRDGVGDRLGRGVRDGAGERAGLGGANGVLPGAGAGLLAGCTAAGTGVGRTRTYSASTPRNTAISTMVEVRGRLLTRHLRSRGRCPGRR
jgi:hypothetical protein